MDFLNNDLEVGEKTKNFFFIVSADEEEDGKVSSVDEVRNCLPRIDSTTFPQEFFPIVGLFAEDGGFCLTDCSSVQGVLSVRSESENVFNDLYLRYRKIGAEKNLIVARVAFHNKRIGNMTKLFHMLLEIKKRFNYDAIVIENAFSEEMIYWCKKNGFNEERPNQFYYR